MRAGARSKNIDPNCIRCGKEENDIHLFFECKFAQAVWFASSLGLRVEGLHYREDAQIHDILHYIITSYKKKDAIQTVFSILWSIWKARNNLLFNKKRCTPLQVLFQAKALQTEKEVALMGKTLKSQNEDGSKTEPNKADDDWHTALKGSKIYVDAAWKGEELPSNDKNHQKEKTGIGIYFDLNEEDHKAIFVQASSYASSALQAEAQAMEVAAQIANKLKVQNSNFLTDNFIVAQSLKQHDLKKNPGHWTIRPNLQQILQFMQGMEAGILKIKREDNKSAHMLAHKAFNFHSLGACLYKCTKHPSNQCPVIAVISKQNVHPCTLLSVNCQ
jgi:ribonuclease HI